MRRTRSIVAAAIVAACVTVPALPAHAWGLHHPTCQELDARLARAERHYAYWSGQVGNPHRDAQLVNDEIHRYELRVSVQTLNKELQGCP